MMTAELNNPENTRRIVVDALNLSHGGGVIVMSRVVDALMDMHADVTVVTAREGVLEGLKRKPTHIAYHPKAAGAAASTLFRRFKMPALVRSIHAHGLVSFNFRTPVNCPQITYHINVIPFLPFAERRNAVGPLRAILQAHAARQALRWNIANAFESEHLLKAARHKEGDQASDFVAYTGIDIPKQAGARKTPPQRPSICMVTSGARHKDNDVALRAFQAFAQKVPGAQLEIFGKPDAIRASLSPELADYCDTSGQVQLRGYVGREDLYATLSKAFALLTASQLESFYMVALEAMIVGCPVVAADISSVRESTGHAGALFPVGNWQEAANALLTLQDKTAWAEASTLGYEWAKGFDAQILAKSFATQLLQRFEVQPS